MSTIIIQHDDCLRHKPGARHPESPQRVEAVLSGIEDLKDLQRLPAPPVSVEQISRAHPDSFWANIAANEPSEGVFSIDADTFLSQGSVDAALRASGAVCFAVDPVLESKALHAFCAVRPPGHHSEPDKAMGFCLLNHIAIGAYQALQHPLVNKVAIIDFDVHHGNGTQAMFENNKNVLYVSSHQLPLYPDTGYANETGVGNILNMPLAPGDGSKAFRHAWRTTGLPAVQKFAPDLIMISAGFDAHERDPLAQLNVQDSDYHWITGELCDLANESCDGRVVSLLEGGYDLQALATAARAHVKALM